MKEETISKIANVLDTWNPLGEKASSIDGLDGYRIEAIDIIASIKIISGSNNIEKAIDQVLSQAFKLKLEKGSLKNAAKEISEILSKES